MLGFGTSYLCSPTQEILTCEHKDNCFWLFIGALFEIKRWNQSNRSSVRKWLNKLRASEGGGDGLGR